MTNQYISISISITSHIIISITIIDMIIITTTKTSIIVKTCVLLVILDDFDVFQSKTFILLVILVCFDGFSLKTICFACSACFFWFPGTFLPDFSKEFLTKSLTETSQGSFFLRERNSEVS